MSPVSTPVHLQGNVPAEMISQGAEAKVWSTTFLSKDTIIKQRFSKQYRHPTLDAALTLQRLKAEVRCMVRARKLGVCTPVPYFTEVAASSIYMERIQGQSVKQALMDKSASEEQDAALMKQIGRAVAKMHDGGLIHGDLTTSNMLLRTVDSEVVFVDFGLSQFSTVPEDKGVDLYVLERALASTHSDKPHLFEGILEAYRGTSSQYSATFNRFAEVRQRGRKRTMVG